MFTKELLVKWSEGVLIKCFLRCGCLSLALLSINLKSMKIGKTLAFENLAKIERQEIKTTLHSQSKNVLFVLYFIAVEVVPNATFPLLTPLMIWFRAEIYINRSSHRTEKTVTTLFLIECVHWYIVVYFMSEKPLLPKWIVWINSVLAIIFSVKILWFLSF